MQDYTAYFIVIHWSATLWFMGGLTLTWYTYMCLTFGMLFREIWYSDWGFHQRRRSPNYISWVYFGQIIVKSTLFGQNWVLFFRKWYTMGGKCGKKLVSRESQIFEVWQAHAHTILVRVRPLRWFIESRWKMAYPVWQCLTYGTTQSL